MVRLIWESEILRFMDENDVYMTKPIKETVVLIHSNAKKVNLSLRKIMEFLGISSNHIPPYKQHKINGKNMGLGIEFDSEYFFKKMDMTINYSLEEFYGECYLDITKLASEPLFLEDNCSDYDSNEYIIISRNSPEYIEFRNMVLRRDRYCQCCGYDKNHKHLVVHHIFGFKNYPQLGYNEDNGITLCKWCHEKYHSIYGKKNPNPVTFGEYMRKYGRD